ncbi:MAG TPA: hypothetical protein ENO03_03360 [Candidatus Aminicenantes bacterium]|nr:hypothetical protein [Candidatus Aminicenantes bacterium]HDT13375.1 hypothetical protein [Candidatus Aminicenantes bacterium]
MRTVKNAPVAIAIALALTLAPAAYPQSQDLGLGAFADESGPILMAVDAGLVVRSLDNPYAMFVLFMAARDQSASVTVAAKDVVMVYKGREYPMPTLAELRGDYGGVIRDVDFYRRLGKEGIMSSWVRLYQFPDESSFFPPLTLQSALAVTEGHMTAFDGFVTPVYFKNPGFAKGDKLTIKVRDAKDASITGECEVVLK